MRIVSLVPSLTDAVAALGRGEDLVGVTSWCTDGAPPHAERVVGTKNPDVDRVVALAPDLVLANTEENRAEDLERLRAAGLEVEETYPRTVEQAARMIRRLGELLDARDVAEARATDVEQAAARARAAAPPVQVMALTLVWRKPWMGLGAGTYASDLLATCGFGNVLSGFAEDYPRLEEGLVLGQDVVLLPSEPYAFGPDDLPAVEALAGAGDARFVDGQALTWHGPRTAAALDVFSALAGELARG